MKDALIGHSGFVGSTLLRQRHFDALYRSTNTQDIKGGEFDLVVCAGAPAQKWLANKEPEADRRTIEGLVSCLESIRARRFVLISTVDVFREPLGVDESTEVDTTDLHAYGRHRRMLESFVQSHFEQSLIVRLPGLVGPGLRKNVIFDFLNDNNLHAIDSRGVFQFYPMVNLWPDIAKALEADLGLVHLTAEPISVADVARHGFNREFDHPLTGDAARYDMRSRHADLFGGENGYTYNRGATLLAIRAYAQSEPRQLNTAGSQGRQP